MTLRHYVKKCMNNKQFAYYWKSDNLKLPEEDSDDAEKAPMTDDEIDVLMKARNITIDDVIKNHGIRGTRCMNIVIKLYEINSKCPVAEFLDELSDQKLKEKTIKNIARLSESGSGSNSSLSEYFADGIYKLQTDRLFVLPRNFFYFFHGNDIIVTNGYIKKSQKTELWEFKRAKQYRDEYSGRFNQKRINANSILHIV